MKYAVLTGDIVRSSLLIDAEERQLLTRNLKDCLLKITNNEADYYLHRGDYFQVLIHNPEDALKYAVIIRAFLKSMFIYDQVQTREHPDSKTDLIDLSVLSHSKTEVTPVSQRKNRSADLDARIAIGIGTITYRAKNVYESDGPAFHNSGRTFDSLRKGQYLSILTKQNHTLDITLNLICDFVDDIIKGWSVHQAETALKLMEADGNEEIKQEELATHFGIKQPTVSALIKAAKWELLKKALNVTKVLLAAKNSNPTSLAT